MVLCILINVCWYYGIWPALVKCYTNVMQSLQLKIHPQSDYHEYFCYAMPGMQGWHQSYIRAGLVPVLQACRVGTSLTGVQGWHKSYRRAGLAPVLHACRFGTNLTGVQGWHQSYRHAGLAPVLQVCRVGTSLTDLALVLQACRVGTSLTGMQGWHQSYRSAGLAHIDHTGSFEYIIWDHLNYVVVHRIHVT